MKKLFTNKKHLIPTLFTVFGLVLILFIPQVTFASTWDTKLLGYLYSFVVAIFGSLLMLGGWALDYTLTHFVVGFGGYYTTSGLGAAIDLLWTKMRDIFNLTFIFGLVYIGFKMILNSSDNNAKKALGMLILAALLVNFSLFFTKTVIDFSNIAAKQFVQDYKDQTDLNKYVISQKVMTSLGITSVINTEGIPAHTLSLGYIFGTMYLFLVAAFVFAAGAILLIIRFIALNIYMLLSPAMFIGLVFPGFSGISKQYMTGFLGQAFFAPAYFLMIYFSMEIMKAIGAGMKDVSSLANSVSGANSAAAFRGFEGPLMFFIVACGFLIASLIVAKKIGAVGADKAVSLGQKAAGKVRNYTQRAVTKPFRVTGNIVKGGVGWGAKNASNFVGNRVGRAFDNAKQYQGRGGAVVRWAARTNFAQDTVGTAVNTMQNAKFGNTRTVEADRQMRNRTEESVRRREELDARNVPPLTPASNADQIAARQEARRVQRAQVGHMSNEEVLNLARTNKAMLLTPEFASLLSDAQVTAIENSGILSTDENINLNTQRNTGAFADIEATLGSTEASQENLTATMEELNRTMSTMSNERLTEMNQSQLINPNIASQLSDAQLTTLQQSGTRTPAQIQEIRNARNAGLTRIVHNGSLASSTSLTTAERDTFNDRQRRRLFRNAQDAGRLPVDALADEAARPYLTPQIITEFLNNNPSQPDIERVRQNVMEYITDPSITDNMTQSWTIWSNTTVQGRRFGLHS